MGLSDRISVGKERKAGFVNTAIFWLKRMHRHRPQETQCTLPSMPIPRRERTTGHLTGDVAEDQIEKLRKVDSHNVTSNDSNVNPKGAIQSPATLVYYSLRGVDSERKQISIGNELLGACLSCKKAEIRKLPRTHGSNYTVRTYLQIVLLSIVQPFLRRLVLT